MRRPDSSGDDQVHPACRRRHVRQYGVLHAQDNTIPHGRCLGREQRQFDGRLLLVCGVPPLQLERLACGLLANDESTRALFAARLAKAQQDRRQVGVARVAVPPCLPALLSLLLVAQHAFLAVYGRLGMRKLALCQRLFFRPALRVEAVTASIRAQALRR